MITKDMLEHFKLTPADLKQKFTAKVPDTKITALKNLIRDRIRDGRTRNLMDYRWWWAMDLSYDAPFRNTTQAIMASFMDSVAQNKLSDKEVLNKAREWKLDQFIQDRTCNGKKESVVNAPVMFRVVIPLCRAYLNIRVARLWAERDLSPFFKYEPIVSTTTNQVRAEVITNAMEMQSQQFGYRSVGRQWIFNALHYGTALMFPAEDWYRESMTDIRRDLEGKTEEKEIIVREGLRYNIPHPSRVFYDQAHRIGTINSDSGVEYAGYWRVARYGTVRDNPVFWNTDKVSMYTRDLIADNSLFFKELYPCNMQLGVSQSGRVGAGLHDRESQVSTYSASDVDKAVFLTDIYMKITPAHYGLSGYKHPIWFRFVVANDEDVLYAAPICYTPALYMGYDAHEERSRVASLSLEIVPFQDHMSNLLTQQILTAKSNLTNVVFADTDIIPNRYLDELHNLGENLYRQTAFIPFSGRKAAMAQSGVQNAFISPNLPRSSVMELMSTFRLLLDMLERVLVFSAQELGATAPHVQTAEEVRVVGGSVTTRTAFTNSFIDDAWYAWKRQLYIAKMAYGSEEVWAHVPAVPPVTRDILARLGFTVDEEGKPGKSNHKVHGPVRALALEGFSSVREGQDRINNPELAIAMSQVVQMLMGNPVTAAAIGPDQALELYNQMLRLSGLPRDFRLRNATTEQQQQGGGVQPEELQQILQQLAVEILERSAEQSAQIVQDAVLPLEESLQSTQDAVTGIAEQIPPLQSAVQQIVEQLGILMEAAASDNRQQDPPEQPGDPEVGEPIPIGRV
jgi:hypothetical protein